MYSVGICLSVVLILWNRDPLNNLWLLFCDGFGDKNQCKPLSLPPPDACSHFHLTPFQLLQPMQLFVWLCCNLDYLNDPG